ncbi:Carbohydrate-Binding Module Family 13 protein, partial [Glomus cerebriforme]
MTYYWIIARHSGKVLEVEGGSVNNCAKVVQNSKKSGNDPNVDSQLWYFNGGFITNKKSSLVIAVTDNRFENWTQIIQYKSGTEPVVGQEWDYNYEDNAISLRSNRNFVIDVSGASHEDLTPTILHNKHGGRSQQFTLQKWSDVENFGKLITNIIDHNKFLPKLSQNLLEILDDEYCDIIIEVDEDPYVKIFRAHMVYLWRK